ncbi:MAG: ATP-dependent metallopeptidase FtsH/Yme1/Tma family protein, partial [Clostridia bacterium]|nr:ATP-dependent metallopeptidase FtsH/Yme1/Tma family protein [Clostridia bacterium]
MNRKPSRGITGYIILLATLLLVAILLNGGLNQTVNRRIEYPRLLEMIKDGKVGRVAIRNNSLVGVTKTTVVAQEDFPERGYDFETTIGEDFLDTVRQIEANAKGVSIDQITVDKLPFTIEYRAP